VKEEGTRNVGFNVPLDTL